MTAATLNETAEESAQRRASDNEYARTRYRLLAYGRWNKWTDAEPIRDHIAYLSRHGIGYRRAAKLAGLCPATVQHWIYGNHGYPPPAEIGTGLAAKMLAVRPDINAFADSALIDGLGTRRRLQALSAAGFPFAYLATHLDRGSKNLPRTMRGVHVEAASARAVMALYEQLRYRNPADYGISARNASYARNWAAKRGWLPPASWDDLDVDSPATVPHDLTPRERTPEETVEDAEFIRSRTGEDWGVIAERLKVRVNTLHQYRTRVRERAAAAAATSPRPDPAGSPP